MRTILATLKCILFALNCLWVIPTQGILMFILKGKAFYQLPFAWHNMARMIFQVKFQIKGTPYSKGQVLYMSNHLSYLDIPLLGSIIKSSFVAKSEVGTWPLFGFLARLQNTAFLQRKRSKILQEANTLQERIKTGESLIIFPEGTSTSGFDVQPFKSSLFMLALGENNENLYLQPITIKVLTIDGKAPSTKEEQDIYAWPFDMDTELHHHLWRFAKTTGATIALTFHDPIKASEFDNRKVLAKTCHEHVSKGLELREAA